MRVKKAKALWAMKAAKDRGEEYCDPARKEYPEISFGIEHGLRKEEMEEQFNREAKEGWRIAADAARITNERASSDHRKHTSGAVFIAADSNLGTVVGEREGAVASIPGNKGRITELGRCAGHASVFGVTSGTRKDGPPGTKPCWRQC